MNQNITLALVAVFAIIGVATLAVASTMMSAPTTSEVEYVTVDANAIDVDSLTIGFIPVEKADELTPKAQALEKFLESELGIDVEIVVPTNYEAIIEGMRFGHIDAAFMDTGPAWITHERTGAEAVLAELVKGKVNYQATVWTSVDNDSINTIEDTVGERVAFTSITGSSGFVRPMGTLVTDGHINIEGNDIVALEQALADNFESILLQVVTKQH